MSKTVIIFGGGVAGLSAAQELAERGFEVHIYERRSLPGGKARSFSNPESGTEGRPDLPAEHGFRFFPRFYRHIPDTMKRIPFGNDTVYGNLIQVTRLEVPRLDGKAFIMPARFPRNLSSLHLILKDVFVELQGVLGLSEDEVEHFADCLWQVLTSCHERRSDELERLSWWDFLGARTQSEGYQKFLAQGLSKFLVAADAWVTNAKVEGDIIVQLFFGIAEPGVSLDRVLNAPTQDSWIDPWCESLRTNHGVRFHYNHSLQRLHCDNSGVITGATVTDENGGDLQVSGNYYLAALPIEVMAGLLKEDVGQDRQGKIEYKNVLKGDPSLAGVVDLGKAVGWMNGLQVYLKKNIGIVFGHELFLDSRWALTSISQQQIWPHTDLSQYGDGEVKDILSVVISDWNTPGNFVPDAAKDSYREEIRHEVWEQITTSLRGEDGNPLIAREDFHSWYLDPDIKDLEKPDKGVRYRDTEPLFVALNNTWHLRPDAHTRIPNLFLAADYIRTNTQLATMEAANEAARRAVNSILATAGHSGGYCKIWPLHEPDIFSIWRWYDRRRYAKGLPWNPDIPAPLEWLHRLRLALRRL